MSNPTEQDRFAVEVGTIAPAVPDSCVSCLKDAPDQKRHLVFRRADGTVNSWCETWDWAQHPFSSWMIPQNHFHHVGRFFIGEYLRFEFDEAINLGRVRGLYLKNGVLYVRLVLHALLEELTNQEDIVHQWRWYELPEEELDAPEEFGLASFIVDTTPPELPELNLWPLAAVAALGLAAVVYTQSK